MTVPRYLDEVGGMGPIFSRRFKRNVEQSHPWFGVEEFQLFVFDREQPSLTITGEPSKSNGGLTGGAGDDNCLCYAPSM